jgi:autotransporter-associated beta strand protein
MPNVTFQTLRRIVVALAIMLGGTGGMAQTVKTFTGTTSEFWTTSTNWSPSGVPNAADVWAQIDSRDTTGGTQRILYTSSNLATTPVMSLGAISFLPTLSLSSGSTLSVQNNSISVKGTLKLFGVDTTIAGQPRRIVLDNSSTLSNVSFTQTNSGQDFELNTSGVIHVANGTTLTSTAAILEAGGARALAKVGPGTLVFSGTTSDDSVYSGGFVMEDGIVQWSNSGSTTASPFGTGPLTLQGGTLRSTTATGRSINVDIVLDGGATLGSTETGFTGNVTVNSGSGSLVTTLARDSVVAIAAGSTTIWNQAIRGTGNLTKAGEGTLNLNGFGGDFTYVGNTVVAAGTLVMGGALTTTGTVTVQSGGTLQGTGSIAGPAAILAGGTLSPGTSPGVLSFGNDLTLAGATLVELNGSVRGTDYDGVNVAGGLGYGGTLALQVPSLLANGTYELFSNFISQTGSFSAITLAGAYTGSLTESAGVWTGSVGGQDFTFTNATGNLSVVPEPSGVVLVGLVAMAGIWRRRPGSVRSRCGSPCAE